VKDQAVVFERVTDLLRFGKPGRSVPSARDRSIQREAIPPGFLASHGE
jgi:hypothetical protein